MLSKLDLTILGRRSAWNIGMQAWMAWAFKDGTIRYLCISHIHVETKFISETDVTTLSLRLALRWWCQCAVMGSMTCLNLKHGIMVSLQRTARNSMAQFLAPLWLPSCMEGRIWNMLQTLFSRQCYFVFILKPSFNGIKRDLLSLFLTGMVFWIHGLEEEFWKMFLILLLPWLSLKQHITWIWGPQILLTLHLYMRQGSLKRLIFICGSSSIMQNNTSSLLLFSLSYPCTSYDVQLLGLVHHGKPTWLCYMMCSIFIFVHLVFVFFVFLKYR